MSERTPMIYFRKDGLFCNRRDLDKLRSLLAGLRALYVKKKSVFDQGVAARLPEAYRKFWRERWNTDPAPVHYVPEPGRWKRNPETGEVSRVQNVPLPVRYPAEHNQGLWGGEGVVQGFLKKHPVRRRVPHFWVPQLRRSVVHSEVLDQHLAVTITDRTISLIHRHHGFDHYLLQTKACDLKSDLALKLKRLILLDLKDKNLYPNDPVKKEEIYNKYKIYLEQYTEEEIEWYGLTMFEAIKKQMNLEAELFKPQPLKHLYRAQLLQKLRDGTIPEVVDTPEQSESWFSKMNPFKEKDSSRAHPS